MSTTEVRYFQWLVGDKRDQIHIFDHVEEEDDVNYICFKDKSRINEEFVVPLNHPDATGKIMAEISHPDNKWGFDTQMVGRQEEVWEKNADGESVCVQPFVEGQKMTKLIPPKKVAPKVSSFGNIVNANPAPPKAEEPVSNIDTSDPVYILMAKSKKQDSDILMTITVSLPSKNLYDIAKESFDNGGEKVIEYIVENMTVKEIKDAVKIALTNLYEGNVENVPLDVNSHYEENN
jgi:hypothetical protein